jgi:hypothetical protein
MARRAASRATSAFSIARAEQAAPPPACRDRAVPQTDLMELRAVAGTFATAVAGLSFDSIGHGNEKIRKIRQYIELDAQHLSGSNDIAAEHIQQTDK